MWRRSMGFWNSIDGGIISCVMKSQAAHMFCHSSTVGSENGDLATSCVPSLWGYLISGNEKRGRSRSQSEYCDELSVQRWTGRRLASVKSVYASRSEN